MKHDKDKSGSIDKGEVPGLLRELNLRLSPDLYARYCLKWFSEADLDGRCGPLAGLPAPHPPPPARPPGARWWRPTTIPLGAAGGRCAVR